MTINELILNNSDKVRRDSNLMAFYVESFEQVMGYKPNCAACTFSSDWRIFVQRVNGSEITNIKTKTDMEKNFKLKKVQHKIFAYQKDKRTYRLYDQYFTNEFVDGFLTNGTKEEITERKKLFEVLPPKFAPKEQFAPKESKKYLKEELDQIDGSEVIDSLNKISEGLKEIKEGAETKIVLVDEKPKKTRKRNTKK